MISEIKASPKDILVAIYEEMKNHPAVGISMDNIEDRWGTLYCEHPEAVAKLEDAARGIKNLFKGIKISNQPVFMVGPEDEAGYVAAEIDFKFRNSRAYRFSEKDDGQAIQETGYTPMHVERKPYSKIRQELIKSGELKMDTSYYDDEDDEDDFSDPSVEISSFDSDYWPSYDPDAGPDLSMW